jgi:hypothetical protein
MNARSWRILCTWLAIAGGVVAIGLGFYVHSSHPWAVGGNWHVGVVVSPQRLLAAMGLVMIVGGLVALRSRVAGGILVAAPVVIALVLIYTHPLFRMTNIRVWAAPIVLATLSSVCAGLALEKEVEPVGLAEAQAQVARAGAVDEAEPAAGPVETPLA